MTEALSWASIVVAGAIGVVAVIGILAFVIWIWASRPGRWMKP